MDNLAILDNLVQLSVDYDNYCEIESYLLMLKKSNDLLNSLNVTDIIVIKMLPYIINRYSDDVKYTITLANDKTLESKYNGQINEILINFYEILIKKNIMFMEDGCIVFFEICEILQNIISKYNEMSKNYWSYYLAKQINKVFPNVIFDIITEY